MSSDLSAALASQEVIPAELDFPTKGLTFTGLIVETSPAGTMVSVEWTLYCDGESSPSRGDLCNVSFVRAREIFNVRAVVKGSIEGVLMLDLLDVPTTSPRRDWHPQRCSLPVVFRAVRPGGSYSAWCDARTYELSLDGASIDVTGNRNFPERIDLQIAIPPTPDHEDIARLAGAEAESVFILKVHGRTCGGIFTREGHSVIGVQFDHLLPAPLLRLGCYLQRLGLSTGFR